MNGRWQPLFCLLVLALLYCFHVALKTAKIFANPTWDETDEVGQFWSECAFQYRFAKFFAQRPFSDWSQLSRDNTLQHPDTVNDWAEFTVLMEVPAGALYRWLKPPLTFHVWVVWYDCTVGSLTLFALFLLARALWQSNFAGLMAASLYTPLYPSYGRTVKNLFLREDFALPLIVLAIWATVRMLQYPDSQGAGAQKVRFPDGQADRTTLHWRIGRRCWEIAAAVLWLAALASWHLTQFLFAACVAATVLVYLGKGETPRRPGFVWTLLAGSFLVPVLRAKQFYLSPAMCALLALSLAVWINGGRKKATVTFCACLAILLTAGMLFGTGYGEYAHVYQLFLYKLRFLGVKPADPSLLPWEARCLWEGAFNTASLSDFSRNLMWCGPLAVAAMWQVERKRMEQRVFMTLTLLLIPLTWMVLRYFTFLAPIAATLAAGAAGRSTVWKLLASVTAVWQLILLDWNPLDRAPVRPELYRPVVRWLQQNTPSDAVVLSGASESPVWRAFADRATVLHPKFENQRIRERYRQFLAALYGRESDLAAFARKHGASLFVYDIGSLLIGPDTWRYKANRLRPLPADCVARRMAEAPAELEEFQLEYRTERFAVFSVKKK
ncbi:MAG: hypothetical protein N3B01_06520 [Verrucomicrobiae bacterium]|nr:hypothetical protein [Verrucomicrobiae bacterium]